MESSPKPFGELWSIAENNNYHLDDYTDISAKTKLFLHPEQIQGSIRGNNLFEFFKQKETKTLNASAWEYLKSHPNLIPEMWKFSIKGGAQYIFFWGTIDRSPEGNLSVRYISWSGGNWVFSYYLLSGNWHEDFPAVILE